MKPYPFTSLLGLVIVSLFMFGHELHNYAPNFEKVDGGILLLELACVRVSHFLYLL